ncbi:Di-copper centre-containing protein [Tothia fuscella]|uniref:tyrosinase n=1 Tax=Tothia fuscella TaxID=1048955 RepID=A0A9P4TTN6_9PEZI|nr:Di-copper centre-containing protein [Tothia fuscella]
MRIPGSFSLLLAAASLVRTATPAIPSVILASSAELQPRLEIRELEKDTDQWNLFLLGFKRLKEVKSSDHLSYFRIAGIHGYPYGSYDGVERCHDCFDDVGYCPHASTLFMTWHRPHLALFEQNLRTKVSEIVNEFPPGKQKDRYVQAAQKLRLPYWDWAKAQPAGQNILPQSIVKSTVELHAPNGTITIENPLLRYQFGKDIGPPGGPDFPLPNDTTVRHFDIPPKSPQSHHDLAVLAVEDTVANHSGPDLRCNLYRLMANSSNLNYLSTKLWDERRNTTSYDNMEAIHDAIHRAIGGDYNDGFGVGTMYWTPAAAFDPIFWMHHAMVDRMFAMWQVLYPDNWLKPADGTETWTLFENNTVDGKTPLTPFHADTSGKFWTSDDIRDHTKLGYTYPEFFDKKPSQSEIKAIINNLYSTGSTKDSKSFTPPKRATHPPPLRSLLHLSSQIPSLTTEQGHLREYTAKIRASPHNLTGSFTVKLYDGPTSDVSTLLGSHFFMAHPKREGGRGRVVRKRDVVGGVTLTTALIERVGRGVLKGMGNEDIRAYLRGRMIWKVVQTDGTMVPSQNTNLSITIVTTEVQPAASKYELPIWGSLRVLLEYVSGYETTASKMNSTMDAVTLARF